MHLHRREQWTGRTGQSDAHGLRRDETCFRLHRLDRGGEISAESIDREADEGRGIPPDAIGDLYRDLQDGQTEIRNDDPHAVRLQPERRRTARIEERSIETDGGKIGCGHQGDDWGERSPADLDGRVQLYMCGTRKKH
jgi:hypothetical protein